MKFISFSAFTIKIYNCEAIKEIKAKKKDVASANCNISYKIIRHRATLPQSKMQYHRRWGP